LSVDGDQFRTIPALSSLPTRFAGALGGSRSGVAADQLTSTAASPTPTDRVVIDTLPS
jgi:hypothetical protein